MSSSSALEDQAIVAPSQHEQLPTTSAIQAAGSLSDMTATMPPTRPFTYNTGHGDFCFLRLVDSYPKPPAGAVDPDFIRSGTFPFMKLPTEIRFQIYELVLAPLLSKHLFIPDERRHLILKIQRFEDDYYEDKLDEVRFILRSSSIDDPELKRRCREEERELAALCKRFLYPASSRAYEITFPRFSDCEYYQTRPVSLASIRNLSNVSCQIREELGICAWSRSFLAVENGAFAEALSCLRDRPAIYRGLKILSIFVQWKEADNCSDRCPQRIWADADDHTCSMAFESLMEFVDQNLQLDRIIIRLDIPIHRVRELLDAAEKPHWIDVLRGLKCARSFALLVTYKFGDSDSEQNAKDPEDGVDTELANLLKPSASAILDVGDEGLDWDWPEEEYQEDPGFYYRLQPNGSFHRT